MVAAKVKDTADVTCKSPDACFLCTQRKELMIPSSSREELHPGIARLAGRTCLHAVLQRLLTAEQLTISSKLSRWLSTKASSPASSIAVSPTYMTASHLTEDSLVAPCRTAEDIDCMFWRSSPEICPWYSHKLRRCCRQPARCQ